MKKTGWSLIGSALAISLLATPALAQERFCEFKTSLDAWDISVGSKSYTVSKTFWMDIHEGVNAGFLVKNDLTGEFGLADHASLNISYASNGTVYLRSNYIQSRTTPSVGIDKIYEQKGKQLMFGILYRDMPNFEILAAAGTQSSAETGTQFFAMAKDKPAELVGDIFQSGEHFNAILATDEGIIALTSDATHAFGFDKAKGVAEAEFTKLQADAQAGVCK